MCYLNEDWTTTEPIQSGVKARAQRVTMEDQCYLNEDRIHKDRTWRHRRVTLRTASGSKSTTREGRRRRN